MILIESNHTHAKQIIADLFCVRWYTHSIDEYTPVYRWNISNIEDETGLITDSVESESIDRELEIEYICIVHAKRTKHTLNHGNEQLRLSPSTIISCFPNSNLHRE